MPLDPDVLLNWPFEPLEHTYDFRDTILYALGVGLGHDPLDEAQLPFVFEEPELLALPTMAVVLAYPGFWIRDPGTGVVWVKILHGEQGLTIHNPLPASGSQLDFFATATRESPAPSATEVAEIVQRLNEMKTGALGNRLILGAATSRKTGV